MTDQFTTSVSTDAWARLPTMKAGRIHAFGGPEVIRYEDIARPLPQIGEVLVQVRAAGVGPWDAWVRSGRSALPQSLPLVLGSDLSGVVVSIGPGVGDFKSGDEVFGVTNERFTGAYAEYAIADAKMITGKPSSLTHIEAASVPVVAVTAWQMLFSHGEVTAGQVVLIHGAAGNVGRYLVQLARRAGARVVASALAGDVEEVRRLGAEKVIPAEAAGRCLQTFTGTIDAVMDTVGGDMMERSYALLKPGGVLVSSVARPDDQKVMRAGIRGSFFLVQVTTQDLGRIGGLIGSGELRTHVGEVLSLDQAPLAHEMLAGRPHRSGKIVLRVADIDDGTLRAPPPVGKEG